MNIGLLGEYVLEFAESPTTNIVLELEVTGCKYWGCVLEIADILGKCVRRTPPPLCV